MITIDNNKNEIIINKSRFICELIYLDNDCFDTHLEEIKSKYKGATHYCYAYIYDNIKRMSDDKEPSGTAGMPILNVLENNNLNHVLCVVIRYFGGVKLGAGGLVRAYTKAVTNCLDNTNKYELIEGIKLKLEFSYEKEKIIDNYIKDSVISKEYENNIIYVINVNKNEKDNLINKINDNCINIEILEDCWIKKSV